MRARDDDGDPLERAIDAHEEGRLEEALDALEELDEDDPDRQRIEAAVRVDAGDLDGARALVERLQRLPKADEDPEILWVTARLLLREWRPDGARRVLQRLAELEPSPHALEELALCAELAGRTGEADVLYRKAHALDRSVPAPPRLSAEAFEHVITDAIRGLPAPFARVLETAEVVVEPVPSRDLVAGDDVAETPPDMLGLFVGASELERDGDLPELPPRIYLFQRNIERACRDRRQLVEEIRVTLLHEIGHMLGYDEEGVAGLGLE
jgi:predicted Zn-dependent protease with MMP-like domain